MSPEQYLEALKRAKSAGNTEAVESIARVAEVSLIESGMMGSDALSIINSTLANTEEVGMIGNLGQGLKQGFMGTLETGALGANALFDEEQELRNREGIQDFFGVEQRGDPDSWSQKIGGGLGSIGAFIPAAFAGKAALPVAAGLGIAAAAGEASERARDFGSTEEERNTSIIKALPLGALEAAPLAKIFKSINRIRGKVPDEVIEQAQTRLQRLAETAPGRMGQTALAEGAQEVVAAVGQNLIEQGYNAERVLFDAAVAEEGTIGGISGAIFQGALDLLGGRRSANTPKRTETPQNEGTSPTSPSPTAPAQTQQQTPLTPEQKQEIGSQIPDEWDEDSVGAMMAKAEEGDDTPDVGEEADLDPRLSRLERLRAQQPQIPKTGIAGLAQAEQRIENRRNEPTAPQQAPQRISPEQQLELDRQTQLRNESLVPGEQQDMFAAERGQNLAQNLQRKEQERQRQEQMAQPTEQEQVDELFAEDARTRQLDVVEEAEFAGLLEQEQNDAAEQKQQEQQEQQAAQEFEATVPVTNELLETSQRNKSQQRRDKIIEDTLASIPEETNVNRLRRAVVDSMKAAGLQDTTLTEPEFEKLKRASGIVEALQKEDADAQAEQQAIQAADIEAPETPSKAPSGQGQVTGQRAANARARKMIDSVVEPKPWADMTLVEKTGFEDRVAEAVVTAMPDATTSQKQKAYLDRVVQAGKSQRRVSKRVRNIFAGKVVPAKPAPVAKKAEPAPVAKKEAPKPAPVAKKEAPKPAPVAKKEAPKPAPVAKKSEPVKTTKPAAKAPTPKKTESQTKKERNASRGVSVNRTGKKNEPAAEAPVRTESDVKAAANKVTTQDSTASAKEKASFDKYMDASDGDVDMAARSIAFDLMSESPERQPRKGAPRTAKDKGKRFFEVDDNEQKNTTDKKLAGTGFTRAQEAYAAVKKTPSMSALQKAVEKYLADPRLKKDAELSKRNVPVTNDTIIVEIAGLENKKEQIEAKYDNAMDKASSMKGEAKRDYLAKTVKPLEDQIKALGVSIKNLRKDMRSKNLPVDALLESAKAVPFGVRASLYNARLGEALTRLKQTIVDPKLTRIVTALINNVGDTKVVVMRNLTSSDGTDVAGYFDPTNNTVYLDAVDGMNAHTILHEVLHAVTSQTLANKSNPTTKQLEKLFAESKDQLGSAYGAKNLDEFVAEAFSNPDFQKMLSRIRPDGTAMSAWGRFLNTVANFMRTKLGIDVKGPQSVMTEMDNLIMSAIHPAPTTRPAGELLMESTPDGVASTVGRNMDNQTKTFNTVAERKKWVNKASDLVTSVPEAVSNVFNRVLQMQGVADMAQWAGLGDIGHRMLKAFNRYRGAQELMEKKVNGILGPLLKKYNALSETQRTYLNTFIYDEDFGATISQVDVDKKDISDYKTDEQRESYKMLKEVFDKMEPSTKNIYREMREFYDNQRKDVEKSLNRRIEETMEKAGAAGNKASRDRLNKKLIERGRLEVYFPLVREGDFVVAYEIRDFGGLPTNVVRQFDSRAEAKQFIEVLKKDSAYVPDTVRERRRSNESNKISDVPPTAFMYDLLNELKDSGVPDTVIADVIDVYTNTLPESSILNSFRSRDNTVGYSKDVGYALAKKGYQNGTQTVRLDAVKELTDLKTELAETVETEIVNNKVEPAKAKYQMQVKQELDKRVNFVINGADNKGMEAVFKNINQTAFVFTIGFNMASALVNLSQVPMVAFPMLGGKYSYPEASKAIREASSIVFGARGVAREDTATGKALAKGSIAHGIEEYFDITFEASGETKIKLRKDLKLPKSRMDQLKGIEQMVLEAKKQGQLTSSFLNEALGITEGGKEVETGFINTFVALSAGMFSQAERFGRQATLIASYNLEYNKLYKEYRADMSDADAINRARTEAAQFAIEYTQRINGGATLEAASGLSQQGIGRVALMYKNYGIHMYTMMFQTARNAVKELYKNDPTKRKEALRQIVGIHGTALFFSGVYGLPIYGSVALIYDAMFGDEDEDDFDTIVQSHISQGWFRGGVNAALESFGVDIDAGVRMRLTDLILQGNKFNPNPTNEETIAGVFGGVGLSIYNRIDRGVDDLQEGNYRRGFEQLAPAALSNILKPFRYSGEGGIRTRRYDLVHDDLSAGEIASQVIGFAPEEYLRKQEETRRFKRVEEAINKKATSLTKKYYVAIRIGDLKTARETAKEMVEFNRRNPQFAITPDRIKTSMKGHIRTSNEMYNGVSLSKNMREYLKQFNEDTLGTVMFEDR